MADLTMIAEVVVKVQDPPATVHEVPDDCGPHHYLGLATEETRILVCWLVSVFVIIFWREALQ